MWPFSALKDFKKVKERDQHLLALDTCVSKGDAHGVHAIVLKLISDKHMDDPLMPAVMRSVLYALEAKDAQGAENIALYLVKADVNKNVQNIASERLLSISAKADITDPKVLASNALIALNIASKSEKDSPFEARLLEKWDKYINLLATKDMQMAFETTCKAFFDQNPAVSDMGLKKWKTLVAQLEKTDEKAAHAEINRVIRGYDSYGDHADALKRAGFEIIRGARIATKTAPQA